MTEKYEIDWKLKKLLKPNLSAKLRLFDNCLELQQQKLNTSFFNCF